MMVKRKGFSKAVAVCVLVACMLCSCGVISGDAADEYLELSVVKGYDNMH